MNAKVHTCGKCRKTYRTDASSGERAFDPHKNHGWQPFCRACDWDAKRMPHRGWKRLQRADLGKRGLELRIGEIQYRHLIACGTCHWCRGDLFVKTGYWLDRVDCRGHYEAGNLVPACGWCNLRRGDLPADAWEAMMRGLIQYKGVGGVFRWACLGDQFAVVRPNLTRLEVRDSDVGQLNFGVVR